MRGSRVDPNVKRNGSRFRERETDVNICCKIHSSRHQIQMNGDGLTLGRTQVQSRGGTCWGLSLKGSTWAGARQSIKPIVFVSINEITFFHCRAETTRPVLYWTMHHDWRAKCLLTWAMKSCRFMSADIKRHMCKQTLKHREEVRNLQFTPAL
jgi:hypothetical protein